MESFQVIAGVTLILLVFLDFFHTTLSGNGFGFLSHVINRLLNRLIISNKNRRIFKYSGLTHVLVTTFLWLSLLFCGAFIIFSASQDMVLNATNHLPATGIQRFYFTSYVLSTLGIGDFIPGNEVGEILAGILSFSGFIMITTGLTYLLSVVQAVLSKKELAFQIATMGEDVEQLYLFFKKDENLEGLLSEASSLRKGILSNSSTYLAFPMVNYFLSRDRGSALVVQLAVLSEVLEVLKLDWEKDSLQYKKISTILSAIEKYLKMGLEAPSGSLHRAEKLNTLRSFWMKFGYRFKRNSEVDRRFTSSLRYAGWNWEEVYKVKEQL